jgi:hypothetical protein
LSTYGVCVGLRISIPGVLPRLLSLLPPGWKNSPQVVVQRLYSLVIGVAPESVGVRRLHVLYADTVPVARGTGLNQMLEAFETDLHRYTAAASSEMTFLHAGVVGWQGRAILIPGRSLTGKTTLVKALLCLGATYYSDEFAVVSNSGLVYPFARPLGIRDEDSYAQTKCTAESLGATSGFGPLPVGLVVFSEFKAGARWQPTPLSPGHGTLELIANSVAVRSQPRRTLGRVHKVARQAVFFKGLRGEAHEAAASILNLSSEHQRLETA